MRPAGQREQLVRMAAMRACPMLAAQHSQQQRQRCIDDEWCEHNEPQPGRLNRRSIRRQALRVQQLSSRQQRELTTQKISTHVAQKNARALTWVGSEVLANRYLEVIDRKARSDAAIRVTDKMPHNFQAVGFIAMLFPNARIIHSKRNALDTCLSCWMQNFNDSHTYSRNLGDAGHHYRQYLDLMAHWHEVLPGRILDVEYEDLVGEQEGISRKIIDHLGLAWDDACLQFHKLERTVLTASVWQVRQPIYKQSAGRWKNYDAHLGPLRKGLGI